MKFVKLTEEICYTTKNAMEGGNAYVYDAKYKNSGGYVVKILKPNHPKKSLHRFKIEIQQVIELQYEIIGIIPILAFELKGSTPWYLMPKATPIFDYFTSSERCISEEIDAELISIKEKIKAIIQISKTLSYLHARNIHHRDIKLSNLYFYNSAFCISDFGLIDYPNKPDITPSGERVGPQGYIPDEMRKNAKHADFKKVDVYELGKTLWALLTNNKNIFQGKYDPDDHDISISSHLKHRHHIVEIEEILTQSTQTIPETRPSITGFADKLNEWITTSESTTLINISQWMHIKKTLFPKIAPETAIFEKNDDIIYALNTISKLPNINHMFFPDGGGFDLKYVEKATEDGCITMNADGIFIVLKPKRLLIENISNDPVWSYIRLELDDLAPHEKPKEESPDEAIPPNFYERLTEISPGEYGNWILGNYGKYANGERLPNGYRTIHRYLRGAFVFFPKSSIYNHTSATYDGRHNDTDSARFRMLIKTMRETFNNSPKIYDEKFNINTNKKLLQNPTDIPSKKDTDDLNDHINKKYTSWNFKKKCSHIKQSIDGNIFFYILMRYRTTMFGGINFMKTTFLNKHSKLETISRTTDETNTHQYFKIATPEEAMTLSISMKKHAINSCKRRGINVHKNEDLFPISFTPHLARNFLKKPSHLFTKAEMLNVLKNGDDSKDNRLVIDDTGHCLLSQNYEDTFKYPVIHGIYHAFNGYVGMLSDIDDVDEEYASSLHAWLKYLKYGTQQSCDEEYYTRDTHKVINEILQYY